jgi:hypothetical protein
MPYEPKDGDISVFQNDKAGNEKRPDMRGTALIEGTKYTVSMWTRKSQKGDKYLSGRIEVAKDRQGASGPPQSEPTGRAESSEMPF